MGIKEKIQQEKDWCYWDESSDTPVLVLNVLGHPNAKQDKLTKPTDSGKQLNIFVQAKPRLGKATEYMLRFLAPQFGVQPADIEVVFGMRNVNKQLRIQSPQKLPKVIERHLQS